MHHYCLVLSFPQKRLMTWDKVCSRLYCVALSCISVSLYGELLILELAYVLEDMNDILFRWRTSIPRPYGNGHLLQYVLVGSAQCWQLLFTVDHAVLRLQTTEHQLFGAQRYHAWYSVLIACYGVKRRRGHDEVQGREKVICSMPLWPYYLQRTSRTVESHQERVYQWGKESIPAFARSGTDCCDVEQFSLSCPRCAAFYTHSINGGSEVLLVVFPTWSESAVSSVWQIGMSTCLIGEEEAE